MKLRSWALFGVTALSLVAVNMAFVSPAKAGQELPPLPPQGAGGGQWGAPPGAGMGGQFMIPGGPQQGMGLGQNPPRIDQVISDGDFLYVTQGLTIYKISKKEMAIKGKVTLPGPFQGSGRFGGGRNMQPPPTPGNGTRGGGFVGGGK